MKNQTQYHTKSREKILEFIKKNKEKCVSANEITEYLKEEEVSVNASTVYRYLNKLCKDEVLIKYPAKKGEMATYQYVEEHHNCQEHLHVQCIKCGKVIHLDCCFMDEISKHILKDHGFVLECKNSIIYGYCRDCRYKEEE